MNKILEILMYHNAFMHGDFETATKDAWNAIASRHIVTKDDGKQLDIENLLQTINHEMGDKMGMMYFLYLLLMHAHEGKLVEFEKYGYAGKDGDNIEQLILFMQDLFSDDIKFITDETETVISDLFDILDNYPKGIKYNKTVKPCSECGGSGKFDETHECLVCRGTREVEVWRQIGNVMNPEYLLELQQFIQNNYTLLGQIIYDYLIYFLLMVVYENTAEDGSLGSRQFGMQTSTDYQFRGQMLYGKMIGKFNGVAEQQDVSLNIPFIGVEFSVPIHIIGKGKYEVPVPEPVKEDVRKNEYGEPIDPPTEPTKSKRFKSENVSNDESKSAYIYTKRDRTTVKGFKSHQHIVFVNLNDKEVFLCTNNENDMILYFNAEKYTRDEVRVAYCNLAGVGKPEIKVLKKTI